MIRLREATPDDLGPAQPLLERFYGETVYDRIAPVKWASVHTQLARAMGGRGMVFVAMDGEQMVGIAAAGRTAPWFNDEAQVLLEMCFYVTPDARGGRAHALLFRALRDGARERGLPLIMVTTPNIKPEKVGRYYERQGGTPWDRLYLFDV